MVREGAVIRWQDSEPSLGTIFHAVAERFWLVECLLLCCLWLSGSNPHASPGSNRYDGSGGFFSRGRPTLVLNLALLDR